MIPLTTQDSLRGHWVILSLIMEIHCPSQQGMPESLNKKILKASPWNDTKYQQQKEERYHNATNVYKCHVAVESCWLSF